MVAAVGVEGEGSQDFAGGRVDDSDVEVVDEHDDGLAGPASADGDLVECGLVAEGDFAGVVDAVLADAVVGVVGSVVGRGFGSGRVGGGWCGAVW